MTEEKSRPQQRAWALARLAASVPDRVGRNQDFLSAVRKIVLPAGPRERDVGLRELSVWILRKQVLSEASGGVKATKGFALSLLESHDEIRQHADAVPHLGALSSLSPLPATRWDYTRLVLMALLELRQQQPAFGLGTNRYGITHGKTPLTGLEILQSWAILGSYGHLFGTFSTERALLFALESDSALEKRFLNQIEGDARAGAEKVLRERDLYRLFYVTAAWRVSRWSGSTVRTTSLALLQRLLAPPADLPWRRLRLAFRRARQLAYSRLHSMIGVSHAMPAISIPSAVRELRPMPQIGFLHEEEETPGAVVGLIDALDQFYGEAFFTSPEASARVLTHMRAFKHWWRQRQGEVEDRVGPLFGRPTDWPAETTIERSHLVRLHVPDGGTGWTGEVRRWLGAGEATWGEANFLVTPAKGTGNCNVVDLYSGARLSPKLVGHIAEILAERNEATWQTPSASAPKLWRSVAAFGLGLLQRLLRENRLAHLDPAHASEGVGLALVARSAESGCGRLSHFIQRVTSDDRRAELAAVRDVARPMRAREGSWFCFLGRLRILDKATGRDLMEIDGLFAFIDAQGVEWHFVEHKSGDASGMRGQLDKIGEHLRVSVPPSDFAEVASGKAAHLKIRWSSEDGATS